jgi:hypothetical protein
LYRLAPESPCLTTAAIIAFQPFGDFLRWAQKFPNRLGGPEG